MFDFMHYDSVAFFDGQAVYEFGVVYDVDVAGGHHTHCYGFGFLLRVGEVIWFVCESHGE